MVFSDLTKRENEVAELILLEKSTNKISVELGISSKTVESHRKSIYLKTGAKTLVGFVKKAMLNKRDD